MWKPWASQRGWIRLETSWTFPRERRKQWEKNKAHTIYFHHYNHFRHWGLKLEPTIGKEVKGIPRQRGKATHSKSILHLLECGTRCGWRWLWDATPSGTVWKSKPVTDRLSTTQTLSAGHPPPLLTLPAKLSHWVMGPDNYQARITMGTMSMK